MAEFGTPEHDHETAAQWRAEGKPESEWRYLVSTNDTGGRHLGYYMAFQSKERGGFGWYVGIGGAIGDGHVDSREEAIAICIAAAERAHAERPI